MNYLKSFVIGSSYIVFAPFYYAVYNSQPKKNYSYYFYTLIAPVWFGLWNMLSLYLAATYKLNLRERMLLISVMSSVSVMSIATGFNTYNFTRDEWIKYYAYLFVKYLFVWNVVIYGLEKLI
jgi:hypothetical protein